ncbi:MAG: M48 family metallopeptidase [Mangrovibacterium sp.]
MNKLVEFKHIGLVEMRVSTRAKRLKLGVKTSGMPFVVIPKSSIVTKSMITGFVVDNSDWIKQRQCQFKKIQTVFTPDLVFHTYSRKLNIILTQQAEKGKAALLKNEIRVILPLNTDVHSDKVQNFIRLVIEESMREEAKQYLPKLTQQLAAQHKLIFNRLSIKKTKTRWGSCSSKKNINLNLHLMRLPEHLIKYVILHELAHTIELNHSVHFWQLLEKICPGAKKLDKELNQYNTEVY